MLQIYDRLRACYKEFNGVILVVEYLVEQMQIQNKNLYFTFITKNSQTCYLEV